jgi:hypothetical protein
MGISERWTIKICPECGRLAENFCYGPRTSEHPRANVIEVEVIPAEHMGRMEPMREAESLRVAAETLREIAEWQEIDVNGEYIKQEPMSGYQASMKARMALNRLSRGGS